MFRTRLSKRSAPRPRRSWQPGVEQVEGRQLLSHLYIPGTDGNPRLEAPGRQQDGRTQVDNIVPAIAAHPISTPNPRPILAPPKPILAPPTPTPTPPTPPLPFPLPPIRKPPNPILAPPTPPTPPTTPTSSMPPTTSTPPTITGERVVLTSLKHNRKGKPIGKPAVSFVLQFSTAMTPGIAGAANHYQVEWASTRRAHGTRVAVLHPVSVTATYDASSDSVTLLTSANQRRFARGGQILVNASPPGGISSAAGAFLTGKTAFTIFARARSIS